MHKNFNKGYKAPFLNVNECNLIKGIDVVKSYGSIYSSTGGGKNVNKAYKFVYNFDRVC